MTTKQNDQAISMGKLQLALESTAKSAKAAERTLKRAQEARDVAQAAAFAAKQAFVDATRAVLG